MYKEKDMQIHFSSFSKECASLWKDMDEDDKAKYVKQAEGDRKRYQREMANYHPPEDQDTPQKKRRKKKDPRMPKRSMSGFMFFSSAKRPKLREQNPSASIGEIAKQLGAAWKIMTADQKAPYEESAKKDRKRYEVEMEQYRKGEFAHEEEEEEEEDDDEEDED